MGMEPFTQTHDAEVQPKYDQHQERYVETDIPARVSNDHCINSQTINTRTSVQGRTGCSSIESSLKTHSHPQFLAQSPFSNTVIMENKMNPELYAKRDEGRFKPKTSSGACDNCNFMHSWKCPTLPETLPQYTTAQPSQQCRRQHLWSAARWWAPHRWQDGLRNSRNRDRRLKQAVTQDCINASCLNGLDAPAKYRAFTVKRLIMFDVSTHKERDCRNIKQDTHRPSTPHHPRNHHGACIGVCTPAVFPRKMINHPRPQGAQSHIPRKHHARDDGLMALGEMFLTEKCGGEGACRTELWQLKNLNLMPGFPWIRKMMLGWLSG